MIQSNHEGVFPKEVGINFSLMLLDSKLIQLNYKSKFRREEKFSLILDNKKSPEITVFSGL
jgi:hypothetical protein